MTEMNGVEQDNVIEASAEFGKMANQFHDNVVRGFAEASHVTIFRELNDNEQLECLIAGTFLAVIGVAFAGIKEQHRDEFMDYLRACLIGARTMVDNRDVDVATEQ